MKKLLAGVFGVLLASNVLAAAPQYQTFTGEIMDSACAKAGSHSEMMQKEGAKTAAECSVHCVKSGAKYVLYDPKTKTVYGLDDQENAYEFSGFQVAVTGKFNKATNMIWVHNIEVLDWKN